MQDQQDQVSTIRWYAVGLLAAIAFVSYLERSNLPVTAELMMPGLGLTKEKMSWVFNSFLIGYGAFQVPAGWLGDRAGARLVLGWARIACGVLTVLTGLLPGVISISSMGIMATLCCLSFLFGVTEAATFPVATKAVSLLMPANRKGIGNGAVLMGSSIGAAVAAPLIALALVHFGWRQVFYLSSLFAFIVGPAWLAMRPAAASTPEKTAEEPSVTRVQREVPWLTYNVFLLAISYFAEGYLLFTFISWMYIYLVEVRHFSLVHGGLVASLPWIAALAATPCGGIASDFLALRIGRVRASQTIISGGYAVSGLLLLAAAVTHSRPFAVLALCLSLAGLYLAEPSFWTTANLLGGPRSGRVSGFMNMVGIAGGVASNALIPWLAARAGWIAAFASGTAMGLMTALIWFVLSNRLRRELKVRGPDHARAVKAAQSVV